MSNYPAPPGMGPGHPDFHLNQDDCNRIFYLAADKLRAFLVELDLLGDGGSAQSSPASVPHDLIIDRCYIHGNSDVNLRRAIALNSASTAIIDSYIAEVHENGADAQAVRGWNGPGPFKIVNNYLEGSGENVMFGGADPRIQNLVPSDFVGIISQSRCPGCGININGLP